MAIPLYAQAARYGHGAAAAGNRRDGTRNFFATCKIAIAHQLALADLFNPLAFGVRHSEAQ